MSRYMIMLKYMGVLALLLGMLAGCTRKDKDFAGDGHEAEPVQVTAYSAGSELFMEYTQPVAGEKAGFLIHLTRLSDFKPVTEGALKLIFTPESGEPTAFTVTEPARPGIYKAEVSLPRPGHYALRLVTEGKGFQDEIEAPEIHVADGGKAADGHGEHDGHGEEAGHGEHDHGEEAGHGEHAAVGAISYLKEQQWVVDFMVAQPARKNLGSFVTAMGELVPVSNAEATVAAPLAGIVSNAKPLPFIGKKVAKGEVVAFIDPPIRPEGGFGQMEAAYAEAKNRVALARKEHDRAKRLYEGKIAPLKRVEEAELALSSARAALAPLERAMASVQGEKSGRIAVRAPIGGTVVEVSSGAGKGVEAGAPIVRIVNTGTLWLKANVPAMDIGNTGKSLDATFTVAGMEGEFKPSRLVSVGDMLDPQTRTLPVLFEVPNASGRLKAGLFANVSIRTGSVAGALTVPKDALVEDEGRWFVFLQISGESFDRREVKPGVEEAGHVQIVEGLKGDERVVTRGAYYVKQAESAAAKGGDDHGHAH